MASEAAVEETGTFGQQIWALLIVVFIGSIGGVLNQVFMYGGTVQSGSFGPLRVPRLQDKI